MAYLLAVLPVLLLIAVSLARGVKAAVFVSLAVTTALFFYWGAPLPYFGAALVSALVSTVSILMIVFGAVFLYNAMERTGQIERISHSLDALHPAREVRFFLIALGLTAFFEGVAGFGTPGAIVPLLLIAMGFDATLAVSVVLLGNGLYAVFGAVGVPLLVGVRANLQLPVERVMAVGSVAAALLLVAGGAVLFFVFRLYARYEAPPRYRRLAVVFYGLLGGSIFAFSFLSLELPTILGALTALLVVGFWLTRRQATQTSAPPDLRPWLPYGALVALLLLPNLFPALNELLSQEVALRDLFGTDITAALKPVRLPTVPFLVVAVGVLLYHRAPKWGAGAALRKVAGVFVVLFPSIAISQLMLRSGVTQPSMVSYLSEMLGTLGTAYVGAAAYLGVTGAFITGSTTVSNVIFAPSQLEAAAAIGVPETLLLALQHSGAALGNAICLFNIIAAASVANLTDYRQVLRHNLPPVLAAGALLGALGLLLLALW